MCCRSADNVLYTIGLHRVGHSAIVIAVMVFFHRGLDFWIRSTDLKNKDK